MRIDLKDCRSLHWDAECGKRLRAIRLYESRPTISRAMKSSERIDKESIRRLEEGISSQIRVATLIELCNVLEADLSEVIPSIEN